MNQARLIYLALLLILPTSLYPLPEGGRSVHREASFSQEGKTLNIQVEDNAILEFDTFNIQKDERVEFLQRSVHSRVLSRVLGGSLSQIQGSLRANGNLYLLNPAGIYFGKDAIVEVGGLYAATGNLSNHDFLADKKWFTGLANRLVNEGFIQGQVVHLIGQKVINKGSIVAPEGVIALVAAQSVLIGQQGSQVFFEIQAPENPLVQGGVEQEGRLLALEGQIFLGAADIYAISLKKSSDIQTRDLEVYSQGGKVLLDGKVEVENLKVISPQGVELSGEVKVSNKASLHIDKVLKLSGLLSVSGAELSIQTLLKQQLIIGDHKHSLFTSEDAQHLQVKLLKVGSEKLNSLTLAPFKEGALQHVKALDLQAVHLKTQASLAPLPSLSLHAKKSIESQGNISSRGNIEIFGDLSAGSHTHLELSQAKIQTPGSIYLKAGGSLVSTQPLNIQAGDELILENISIQAPSAPSLFTAKNAVQVEGRVLVQGGAKFEIANGDSGSFITGRNAELISSSISIDSGDVHFEGKLISPLLHLSSKKPILLGKEQEKTLSISSEELNFFELQELKIGNEHTASIRVFSLPTNPLEKYVLHAKQVSIKGSELSFPSLHVQALEKITLDSKNLQVDEQLFLNAPLVHLKGQLAMGQLAQITASDQAILTGNLSGKAINIQGKKVRFEELLLNIESEGSLLVGEKQGTWVEELWMDEKSLIKTQKAGRIDLLATKEARVHGRIVAKEGKVEVSSKGWLDFQAQVDLMGKYKGQLWLDPEEFFIAHGTNTLHKSYLSPNQLLSLLQHADVLLEAQQRLYLQAPLEELKNTYQQLTLLSQGEVYLQAPVRLSASLHVQAKEAIYLQASLQLEQDLKLQAPQIFSSPGYQLQASSIYLNSLQAGSPQTPLVLDLKTLRQLPQEKYYLASLEGEEQQAFHKWSFSTPLPPSPKVLNQEKKKKQPTPQLMKKKRRLGAYDSMALQLQGERKSAQQSPQTSIERLLKRLKP